MNHFKKEQLFEYKKKHIFLFLSSGNPLVVVWRLPKLPSRLLEHKRFRYYTKALPKYK